jgi:hypothetical protein
VTKHSGHQNDYAATILAGPIRSKLPAMNFLIFGILNDQRLLFRSGCRHRRRFRIRYSPYRALSGSRRREHAAPSRQAWRRSGALVRGICWITQDHGNAFYSLFKPHRLTSFPCQQPVAIQRCPRWSHCCALSLFLTQANVNSVHVFNKAPVC